MMDKLIPLAFIGIIAFGLIKTCLPKKDNNNNSNNSTRSNSQPAASAAKAEASPAQTPEQ